MTTQLVLLDGPRTRPALVEEVGEWAVRSMLASGQLQTLWPGIVVPRALVLDPLARATGALLRVGPAGALTGRTAAWLHGCAAALTSDVHVALSYETPVRSRPGLIVHQGRALLDEVVDVHGLRTVPLDVAVAELLCTDRRRDALAIADQAASTLPEGERPTWRKEIAYLLDRRPDRRGTVRGAELLALVTGKADSPPESWLRLLVVDAGFPPPVMQHEVIDVWGRVRHVLDQCWPELRIALEYDGHGTHDGRDAEDARRDEDLERLGWLVVRVRARDLREPERLLHLLDEAFRRRGGVIGAPRR